MTETDPAKPQHLTTEYAAQFGDEEVAAAYRHRPPYPAETFAILEPLLGLHPRCVLELGAGSGDFTVGLVPRVDHLIAVEPSRSMLERAVHRDGAVGAHVEWLAIAAEDYAFDRRYSAVVAAEAFHWLDWHAVLPRIADSLVPGVPHPVSWTPAGDVRVWLPWRSSILARLCDRVLGMIIATPLAPRLEQPKASDGRAAR